MDKNAVTVRPGAVSNMQCICGRPVYGEGPHAEHPPHGAANSNNLPAEPPNLDSLSLNGARKKEKEVIPFKTPVTVLQELFGYYGITPKYELVKIEGMVNQPTFYYRTTVLKLKAMGMGRTKKEAKDSSAQALLDMLEIKTSDQIVNKNLPENNHVSSLEDSIMENPVGRLQNLCITQFWPLPSYRYESDNNNNDRLPYQPRFTAMCTLLDCREKGTGESKKSAKRCAANKMWQTIQNNPQKYFQSDQEVTHLNKSDVNYVELLKDIASEQSFETIFIDIEEKSITGLNQYLITLSIKPVVVFYGSGITKMHAQAAAAQNALDYLKIRNKKFP